MSGRAAHAQTRFEMPRDLADGLTSRGLARHGVACGRGVQWCVLSIWHGELVASVAEPVASWASVARYCIAQPQRTGVLTGTLGLLTGTLVYASRTLDALDRVDEIVPLRALLVRPQQRIASAGFHAGTLPPLRMRVADTWTALSRDKRARARLDRRATVARERNARRSDGRRRIQAETPQRSLAGLQCGGCSPRWRHAESRARFRRTS
jgi:hypothetical protein